MRLRFVKFITLACTILWATGIAQLGHEIVEHGAFSHINIIQASASNGATWNAVVDDDDDGDCPTCLMLATMASDQIVAPTLPDLVGRTCIDILPVIDREAPVLAVRRIEPARGPPNSCLIPPV